MCKQVDIWNRAWVFFKHNLFKSCYPILKIQLQNLKREDASRANENIQQLEREVSDYIQCNY